MVIYFSVAICSLTCYPRVDLTPYNFLSAYWILKIVQLVWWYTIQSIRAQVLQPTLVTWRTCGSPHSPCCADVIWVILSVEEGGLLGVTQQLSSFETEFNTQPHRSLEGDFNPFASPQKNKQDTNEDHLKDPGGHWEPPLDSIQQDQNGLNHSSVNITPNGLQNNLSVVTYSQVCMPFGVFHWFEWLACNAVWERLG